MSNDFEESVVLEESTINPYPFNAIMSNYKIEGWSYRTDAGTYNVRIQAVGLDNSPLISPYIAVEDVCIGNKNEGNVVKFKDNYFGIIFVNRGHYLWDCDQVLMQLMKVSPAGFEKIGNVLLLATGDGPSALVSATVSNGEETIIGWYNKNGVDASYGQRVKLKYMNHEVSGVETVGDSFLLHALSGANRSYPKLAVDEHDRFVCFFTDYSSGIKNYAQQFVLTDNGISLVGSEILISDASIDAYASSKYIVTTNGDRFLAGFTEHPGTYYQMYVRQLKTTQSGVEVLGDKQRISPENEKCYLEGITALPNPAEKAIVGQCTNENYDSNIFYSILSLGDLSFDVKKTLTQLNENMLGVGAINPRITSDDIGKLHVVWSRYYSSSQYSVYRNEAYASIYIANLMGQSIVNYVPGQAFPFIFPASLTAASPTGSVNGSISIVYGGEGTLTAPGAIYDPVAKMLTIPCQTADAFDNNMLGLSYTAPASYVDVFAIEFLFTDCDGSGFNRTITAYPNQAPNILQSSVALLQGASVYLTEDKLNAIDFDPYQNNPISFSVSNCPHFTVKDVGNNPMNTFTLLQSQAGEVKIQHNDDEECWEGAEKQWQSNCEMIVTDNGTGRKFNVTMTVNNRIDSPQFIGYPPSPQDLVPGDQYESSDLRQYVVNPDYSNSCDALSSRGLFFYVGSGDNDPGDMITHGYGLLPSHCSYEPLNGILTCGIIGGETPTFRGVWANQNDPMYYVTKTWGYTAQEGDRYLPGLTGGEGSQPFWKSTYGEIIFGCASTLIGGVFGWWLYSKRYKRLYELPSVERIERSNISIEKNAQFDKKSGLLAAFIYRYLRVTGLNGFGDVGAATEYLSAINDLVIELDLKESEGRGLSDFDFIEFITLGVQIASVIKDSLQGCHRYAPWNLYFIGFSTWCYWNKIRVTEINNLLKNEERRRDCGDEIKALRKKTMDADLLSEIRREAVVRPLAHAIKQNSLNRLLDKKYLDCYSNHCDEYLNSIQKVLKAIFQGGENSVSVISNMDSKSYNAFVNHLSLAIKEEAAMQSCCNNKKVVLPKYIDKNAEDIAESFQKRINQNSTSTSPDQVAIDISLSTEKSLSETLIPPMKTVERQTFFSNAVEKNSTEMVPVPNLGNIGYPKRN